MDFHIYVEVGKVQILDNLSPCGDYRVDFHIYVEVGKVQILDNLLPCGDYRGFLNVLIYISMRTKTWRYIMKH